LLKKNQNKKMKIQIVIEEKEAAGGEE